METRAEPLPDDVAALQAMVWALRSAVASRDAVAAALEEQLAALRRQAFGKSSEKLERRIDQLELALECAETDLAAERARQEREETHAPTSEPDAAPRKRRPARKPLPKSLPRRRVEHSAPCACGACGGPMRRLGEDVTEVLEFVPGHFEVVEHVRPKVVCRHCEAIEQAPIGPGEGGSPIPGGLPGPKLLAHVLVSKFADHLPLYRQSQIYARGGVDLARSTMADWVGRAAEILRPLVEAIEEDVLRSAKIHGDDTTVPVLDPGRKKTKTGRLWVYVRDDRPSSGPEPPAAIYFYEPDRRAERPQSRLATFEGVLQADGYAGFEELYKRREDGSARVIEAACMAHARRKFHDVHAANGSPIAREALTRIAELYRIESEVRGTSPERRRAVRQEKAKPLIGDLKTWLVTRLDELPGRSRLAKAIQYSLKRWPALTHYLDDGAVEIDNSAAERALRNVALGRKNWLFAGSDAGGKRAAAVYTMIETAKLNGVEPEAWLAEILDRIQDHPARQIRQLLPWNWTQEPQKAAA